MLKYFETTTLILAWCFALTLAWGVLVYWRAARRQGCPSSHRSEREGARALAGITVPALVVGPVALVGAFHLAGINLLFPVRFFVDFMRLAAAAVAPAAVLVISSGLGGHLLRQVAREHTHWRGRPFVLMAQALGQSSNSALRRLVLVKSLCGAWNQCLPWLFGELVIVECIFNAPGLGLDAWHAARIRDFGGLAEAMIWLAGLYLVAAAVQAWTSAWIGRRLETYG